MKSRGQGKKKKLPSRYEALHGTGAKGKSGGCSGLLGVQKSQSHKCQRREVPDCRVHQIF